MSVRRPSNNILFLAAACVLVVIMLAVVEWQQRMSARQIAELSIETQPQDLSYLNEVVYPDDYFSAEEQASWEAYRIGETFYNPDNITESLAKDITTLAASQGENELDEEATLEMAQAILDSYSAKDSFELQYNLSDLKEVATGPNTVRNYANNLVSLEDIFANDIAGKINAVYYGEVNISVLIERYHQLAQDLTTIAVPDVLLQTHLDRVNIFDLMANTYSEIFKANAADPAKVVLLTNRLSTLEEAITANHTAIIDYIASQKIIFYANEPAYQVFNLTS